MEDNCFRMQEVNTIRSIKYVGISVLTLLIFLAGWYLVAKSGLVSPLFVPSPVRVWETFLAICFGEGYKGSSLWVHLGVSLYRIGLAFVLAALIAVPLGLVCGYSKTLQAMISPIVHFYRPLPPLAYYTVLVIWLGIGDASKVALLFFAGFAPIFISCQSAIEEINPSRVIVAHTLGASTRQVFFHVIIPSCLPQIFTGLRTSLGFIYTTLVAAEMVAAVSGVGWMVLDASKFLQSDVMFVGIILMGITGLLIDAVFNLIERKVIPWKGRGE